MPDFRALVRRYGENGRLSPTIRHSAASPVFAGTAAFTAITTAGFSFGFADLFAAKFYFARRQSSNFVAVPPAA
ncbi:MAG: hypothetical protein ACKVQJ_03915 [Pyrinomonadaceae bacterium]